MEGLQILMVGHQQIPELIPHLQQFHQAFHQHCAPPLKQILYELPVQWMRDHECPY